MSIPHLLPALNSHLPPTTPHSYRMTDAILLQTTFNSFLRDTTSATRYNYHRPHTKKLFRYQPYPYRLDQCVNCKESYHYERAEQDRNWDDDTWPVIGKHWSTCENRILQRVSGLRATLKDSDGTSKDSTATSRPHPRLSERHTTSFIRTSPFHAHSSNKVISINITERLSPGSSRPETLSPTLPERNYTSASSHVFVQPHLPLSPPIQPPRPIATPVTDTTLAKDPSPFGVVSRSTPILSLHKETRKRLWALPLEGASPLSLDRKRKMEQYFEDNGDDEDCEINNATGHSASTLPSAVQSQPQGLDNTDKPRVRKRARVTSNPVKPSSKDHTLETDEHLNTSSQVRDKDLRPRESRDRSTTVEKPIRKRKKAKTNQMDWRVRRKELEDDPLIGAVEPTEVFCISCDKWVSLDARNGYYPGLWRKHKRTMHEIYNDDGSLKLKPKRRRKDSNKIEPSSRHARKSV